MSMEQPKNNLEKSPKIISQKSLLKNGVQTVDEQIIEQLYQNIQNERKEQITQDMDEATMINNYSNQSFNPVKIFIPKITNIFKVQQSNVQRNIAKQQLLECNEIQILKQQGYDQKIQSKIEQDIQNSEQQECSQDLNQTQKFSQNNQDKIVTNNNYSPNQKINIQNEKEQMLRLCEQLNKNEIKSPNKQDNTINKLQQFNQRFVFTKDFIEKVRILFIKLMKADIPHVTKLIDIVIYNEEIGYNDLSVKFLGYVTNQALWYKFRKFEFNFQAFYSCSQNSEKIKNKINRDPLKYYVFFYKFLNIEKQQYLNLENLQSTIEQLEQEIKNKQNRQQTYIDEIQTIQFQVSSNNYSGYKNIDYEELINIQNEDIKNVKQIEKIQEKESKIIQNDLEQKDNLYQKSLNISMIVNPVQNKQINIITEDLLESGHYYFSKLMNDKIPPLTVMIDTVIYKQEINYDAQIIKFKGFTVNKAVWYKLRKFEYTLYVVNKSEVNKFQSNNIYNSQVKPFPEKDLVQNFCIYYYLKQFKSEQFMKEKSLQKTMKELQNL